MERYIYSILLTLFLSATINAQSWFQTQKIVPTHRGEFDSFGESIDVDGNYAIVCSQSKTDLSGLDPLNNAGAAYILEKNGAGVWIEKQKLLSSDRITNQLFASSVAISGNIAVVGAR